MPTPLTDADKVLRNDTGKAIVEKLDDIANAISAEVPDELSELRDVNISSPTSNQALVYNPVTQKWENGEVSTVGGLNDLNDVNIDDTSLAQGQELVYNPDTQKWENAMIPQTGTIEDVAIASFNDGADDVPVSELIVDIDARQEGSGTPSPDNVRAIHGFDSGVITRCGKNLFTYDLPIHKGYWGASTFNGDDRVVPIENATAWTNIRVKVNAGTKITISGMQAYGGVYSAFLGSDDPTDIISTFLNANMNGTHTVPSGAKYVGLCFYALDINASSYPNAQLEISETQSPFTAYNGNNYTVDFGQTVYGGSYDANSSKVAITHTVLTFNGSENWTTRQSGIGTLYELNITEAIKAPLESISNMYVWEMNLASNNTFRILASGNVKVIAIHDEDRTDLATFKSFLSNNNLTICCELVTPIEIDVTPVQVKTLLNNNNIYADTGNVEKIVYFKTGCENIAKLVEAAPNLASVQSVNGQTGAVELDAFNIPYDSENSIAEKVAGVEDDVDTNTQAIGNLSDLDTTDKSSLVGAVNEVRNGLIKYITKNAEIISSQSYSDFRYYDISFSEIDRSKVIGITVAGGPTNRPAFAILMDGSVTRVRVFANGYADGTSIPVRLAYLDN